MVAATPPPTGADAVLGAIAVVRVVPTALRVPGTRIGPAARPHTDLSGAGAMASGR